MDYDVEVTGLASPPASAVLTQYRPAVSVRNSGIHDALASGYLRIYSAGLLIFETEVYSGTLSPGQDGEAQAIAYWTPPAEGTYIIQGYVTCPLDQVEPNNNLTPVTVLVSGEPPPPPPVVPYHAAQHEEDGADQLSLDGLRGVAADPQTPKPHKASHQPGGSDLLDVTGLPGILAQGQPIADHKETHETGGSDRINVGGLYGELYNLQKPKVHGNEAHDPNYATYAEFDDHRDGVDPHHDATGLEHTRYKGVASGYAPLDENVRVPPGHMPLHAASHGPDGDDGVHGLSHCAGPFTIDSNAPPATILEYLLPNNALGDHFHARFDLAISGAPVHAGDVISINLFLNDTLKRDLTWMLGNDQPFWGLVSIHVLATDSIHYQYWIQFDGQDALASPIIRVTAPLAYSAKPNPPITLKLTAQLTGGLNDVLEILFLALSLPAGLQS